MFNTRLYSKWVRCALIFAFLSGFSQELRASVECGAVFDTKNAEQVFWKKLDGPADFEKLSQFGIKQFVGKSVFKGFKPRGDLKWLGPETPWRVKANALSFEERFTEASLISAKKDQGRDFTQVWTETVLQVGIENGRRKVVYSDAVEELRLALDRLKSGEWELSHGQNHLTSNVDLKALAKDVSAKFEALIGLKFPSGAPEYSVLPYWPDGKVYWKLDSYAANTQELAHVIFDFTKASLDFQNKGLSKEFEQNTESLIRLGEEQGKRLTLFSQNPLMAQLKLQIEVLCGVDSNNEKAVVQRWLPKVYETLKELQKD